MKRLIQIAGLCLILGSSAAARSNYAGIYQGDLSPFDPARFSPFDPARLRRNAKN